MPVMNHVEDEIGMREDVSGCVLLMQQLYPPGKQPRERNCARN
jgi:hypothetical protein